MSADGGTGSPVSCPGLAELPGPEVKARGFPWTEETPAAGSAPGGEALPLVTMVTPSLDQARFLERTIRSVLLQGYPRLEYVILDGGSTDGSVDIIRKYERWVTYWRSAPDGGQAAAINEGFERAKGDVVGWLNSDDVFTAGALHAVARAHADDPDAAAWCGTGLNVDERGKVLFRAEPRGLTKDALASGPPNLLRQAACLFSRDAIARAGGVDEGMTCAFDFDLLLKLADLGRFRKVDSVLAESVIHEGAKTQRMVDVSMAEHAVALMRHGYEAETVREITRRMKPYVELAARARRASANPFYRAVRPLLRALGLVGRRPR